MMSRLRLVALAAEPLRCAANFVPCVVVYLSSFALLTVPGSSTQGEAIESIILTAVYFLPLEYVMTYVPLRVLLAWFPGRRRLLFYHVDFWLPGAVVGVFLAMVDTSTRGFWFLIPIVQRITR